MADKKTTRLLVPIDGSENSDRVVAQLIAQRVADPQAEIHLINVQIPVESGHARMFVSHDELQAYYHEEGMAALAKAREALDRAGVAHTDHIAVGHIAETIARFAEEQGFDRIVMGTHGRSALTHLLLGSVATDVIRHTAVPVTLVK